MGIQSPAQQLHRGQVVRGVHPVEVTALVAADAVLAADAAAGLHTQAEDLAAQLLHPLAHTRLAVAVEDQGVEVAVAGMEHVGHRQAMALAEPVDGGQHPRQGAAGHHAVLEVVAGETPAQGGDGRLAPLPQAGPLHLLPGLAHLAGAGLAAEALGELCGGQHLALLAIELDQEHGRRIGRILRLTAPPVGGLGGEVVVHRLNGEPVHHFHAGRQHAGGRDQPHRLAGGLHTAEIGQQHRHALGCPQQAQGDGGGDAEGALAADEGAADVELGRLIQLASQLGDGAVRQHHLQPQHVVAGHAVLKAVHPPGVLGHIAADAAGHLAGGIGGEVIAIARHRPGDPAIDHTGLHHHPPVGQVHLQHPAHAAGGHHQRLRLGHGAAGETGATAAGHKRHTLLMTDAQHGRHLLGRLRQHHQGGLVAMEGEAIAVVGQELLAGGHHGAPGQDLTQTALQRGPVVAHR